jgi:transposase-like protein
VSTMPHSPEPSKSPWETIVEDAMRGAIREAIERIVDEELAAALGPRYERRMVRVGYRHGMKTRRLTTPAGPTVLRVPRARLTAPAGGCTEW